MTTRRDALAAFSALSAAAFTPAQVPKAAATRRIGDLSIGQLPPGEHSPARPLKGEEFFWERMKQSGWILGENLLIDRAYAGWKSDRLTDLAAELVRRRVDVIICDDDTTTIAAARATQRIPILFSNVFLPVELGFVDSLPRPGRNLTGFSSYSDNAITTKRLEFMKAIVPSAVRLSWIEGGDDWFIETVAGRRLDLRPILEAPAKGLGFEMRFDLLPTPEEIDKVFERVVAWPAQALTTGGPQVWQARKRVIELSLRHRLPFVSVHRGFVEAGGLLSYGVSRSEGRRRLEQFTEYLDRILRGTKPAELPVMQPATYEVVINMKTAKALDLSIPQAVLQRVDEVIE